MDLDTFEAEIAPVLNASLPPCRAWVNQGRCRHGLSCSHYHPTRITNNIRRQVARREPGFCHCGATLKTVMKVDEADNEEVFFKLCRKTGNSINNCLIPDVP